MSEFVADALPWLLVALGAFAAGGLSVGWLMREPRPPRDWTTGRRGRPLARDEEPTELGPLPEPEAWPPSRELPRLGRERPTIAGFRSPISDRGAA